MCGAAGRDCLRDLTRSEWMKASMEAVLEEAMKLARLAERSEGLGETRGAGDVVESIHKARLWGSKAYTEDGVGNAESTRSEEMKRDRRRVDRANRATRRKLGGEREGSGWWSMTLSQAARARRDKSKIRAHCLPF